ncbi:hypothetical protein GCM10011365_05520 [Marinicella pacifica]|uniref:Uncharacterized protein n=1 Tax=Marinicella pacifica TaxID=1171543 RepID=A0A917CFE7_9GAMM|nr:hypothetical protein [Marinicella pacifica]GGF87350.1 hypothetical protein GCM10011365_05520 [Marinicella pacifica]
MLPQFNIIFIPGTVSYQSIALISMLQNTDLNFRLVGNSLNQNEAKLLEQISECSNRLTYANFESDQIIPHGTLLDLLFISENNKYFCFCDSDLFLFKPLSQKQLLRYMRKAVVFSSGGRIENEDEAIYAGFKGGATTKSPDGKIDLATSFFCIYSREHLKRTLLKYKVGFEQYRLDSQIPDKAKKIIDAYEIEYEMFDTGKLLSVLYHYERYKKSFDELDGLVHIGGMSGRYLQKLDITSSVVLDDSELPSKNRDNGNKYNFRNEYEKNLKRHYGKYFYCYLNHIIGKGAKPTINTNDKRIKKTIKRLESEISYVWEQAQLFHETKKIAAIIKSS